MSKRKNGKKNESKQKEKKRKRARAESSGNAAAVNGDDAGTPTIEFAPLGTAFEHRGADATAVFKSKNGHDSKSTSDAATEAGEAAVATALLAASEVGALVERMFAARRGGACVNPIVREGGHPDGEGRRVPQLRRDRRSMASR